MRGGSGGRQSGNQRPYVTQDSSSSRFVTAHVAINLTRNNTLKNGWLGIGLGGGLSELLWGMIHTGIQISISPGTT